MIHNKGTPKEVQYFNNLKMKQKELLADDWTPPNP